MKTNKPIKVAVIEKNRSKIERYCSNLIVGAIEPVELSYNVIEAVAQNAEQKLENTGIREYAKCGCVAKYSIPVKIKSNLQKGMRVRDKRLLRSIEIMLLRGSKKNTWYIVEMARDIIPVRSAHVELIMTYRACSDFMWSSTEKFDLTAFALAFTQMLEIKHQMIYKDQVKFIASNMINDLVKMLHKNNDNPTVQSAMDNLRIALALAGESK